MTKQNTTSDNAKSEAQLKYWAEGNRKKVLKYCDIVKAFINSCPDNNFKELALNHLKEARFWAEQSIIMEESCYINNENNNQQKNND